MKAVINKISRYLNPSGVRALKVEAHKSATFKLTLDGLVVGYLKLEGSRWIFEYSDEFKEAKGIQPLTNFPDINKTYVSEELWPFFSARIPSMSRSRVKNAARKQGIDENDLIGLLNRFGRKTITNPFELTFIE